MNMQQGHAASTCGIGNAAWTCSRSMQHVNAKWNAAQTCSVEIQPGHAACMGFIFMLHVHAVQKKNMFC
jgi:hypothetical protein